MAAERVSDPMSFTLHAGEIRKSFGGVEVLHGVDLDATGGSVLALLGENGAGKSTLVKIIAGDYVPDSGSLDLDGVSYPQLTPRSARDLGIAIINQEFQDAATLSVAENICLGRLPGRYGFVDWSTVRERARKVLTQLEVDIHPEAVVGELRVGERQIVEIARALSGEAKLLILDEPTAALSHHEATVLFAFIRRLRARGIAVVYITHRLDEVTQIADRVQVLRDGSTALLADVKDVDRRSMVEAMIGRRMAEVGRPTPGTHPLGEQPAIQWDHASSERAFSDVSADVRGGEVVAIFGKLGSGAAELGETAFGLRKLTAGTLAVEGHVATLKNPVHAIKAGIGFLPAERKAGGAFMVRPVSENVAVASWPRLATMGQFLTASVEAKAYNRWRQRLSIRSRNDPRQTIGTLSGGNQQKVLLARWLERASRALVLIEPTRGVDVGAREDIYRALRDLAASGIAVLVITSDYEEAVQVADRAYVMAKGAIVANYSGDQITTSRLLEAAGG
jgi:ribose transport system ATP-binding protein